MRVVALCGGVGGAKLAHGLAQVLPPRSLTVIVNTADDFRRYGLHISPDVDTVLYTLAGLANAATGWGIQGDSDRVMQTLRELHDDPWFHLGDRDLATHLVRTEALYQGETPTRITARLALFLGVPPGTAVLPMTDAEVATTILTQDGWVPFQQWFVRQQCTPHALGVRYAGLGELPGGPGGARSGTASPTPEVLEAIAKADRILIGPSNPYLSIGPILALPGVRNALRAAAAPVVAVSPIVGGQALKGPAAQMLSDLAGESSSFSVARLYQDVLDGIVIDPVDMTEAAAIEDLGIWVAILPILMLRDSERADVARSVLGFAGGLAQVDR